MINPFSATLIIALFFNSMMSCAQETQDSNNDLGKFETLVSKKGTMLKFQDTNLSPIRLAFSGAAQTKIRKVIVGSQSTFFFLIEQKGQYRTEFGAIAYDDLLDLAKAIDVLESELPGDVAANPDYLENKYITDDGFRLGYLIQKNKATWYLALDGKGSDNIIFVSASSNIREALLEAKAKIETLKN
jgi:hypothetical protein